MGRHNADDRNRWLAWVQTQADITLVIPSRLQLEYFQREALRELSSRYWTGCSRNSSVRVRGHSADTCEIAQGQLNEALRKLSKQINWMCIIPHPYDTKRDSGGWIDIRYIHKEAPTWLKRDYGHCLNELILYLVCRPDDKGGRFQVAMPITETVTDSDGTRHTRVWVEPDTPCGDRWQSVENFRMANVGNVWYIRTTQGQLKPKTYLMDRFFQRMDATSLSWCHSLTHMTSVEALQSILQKGVLPVNRVIFLSPFPPWHPHHTQGSRSRSSVVISIKKEALLLVRTLHASSCSSVLCAEPIPRELIQVAFLMPRCTDHRGRCRLPAELLTGFSRQQLEQAVSPLPPNAAPPCG